MKKWHLYGLVLIVAILVFSTVFLGLMTVYNSDLTSQYVELSDDFAALEEAYDGLEARHDSLQSKYNSLLPDPSSGINESDSYKILHKLQDELQTEFDNYVAEYQEIRRAIDQRLLRAPAEPFITPFDPEVVSVVNEITGGYTNSSKPSDYWPNIKAMYDWVKNNIEYRADGLYPILPYDPADGIEHKSQMVQFPNETLSMREGDCEDQATLLCSMIRCYVGVEFTVECVWITSETFGHVAVQIPVSGQQIVILDTVGDYYSSDTFGNIMLKGISAEIYDWLDLWRPKMGNDIYVFRVFSDYVDKYFSTTGEYIAWMYTRY